MEIKHKNIRQFCRVSSFLLLSLAISVSHAEEDVLSRAKALHEKGQAQQAYQLLQSNADEYAGTSEYDYLLGQAAIDAGQPLEAVFALERQQEQS